ncbi:tetraacyldisaccharide 4'-kinase [Marivirga aurantiaca]|nr:tetraacyldisaccharide 4'-kinase [Marivirga aurantiaca]
MSPFSLLYKWVMQFRNHLYNIEYKAIFQFETTVISVGNLSVGGTGKTPMVEYIIRFLLKNKLENKITTLSRGYGRNTKGFRMANEQDDANTLGDEPFQIYRKFRPAINVAVGEDRVLAIPSILYEQPENEVIILDDAFQHRSVKPNLSIVLSDYQHLFYKDYVLPSGRLRESRSGVSRADALVITKCPDNLSAEEMGNIRESASIYMRDKPIYFSGISYGNCYSPYMERPVKEKIAVVTGIAHPEPLLEFLKSKYKICKHFRFQDHHYLSSNEIQEIALFAQENQVDVLTTEKDWVKLINHSNFEASLKNHLFYVPMMVQFLDEEKSFQQLIEETLKEH